MNSALPKSTYHSALAIALQAAQAAGELLRAEFHRPGGPRGSGAHALIDEEAEALIRQQLRAAFPDYGVRGEELRDQDCLPQDAEQHTWLIDPNDGTASFIKGYRGSAVSIALLCSGVPVLGVVYAFAAPQDGGDLFAWAEGCGPLTRNGIPIQRQWATAMSHHRTVLLSQAGDRHSQANAELVAPARFRAVPSIAYRLALVAAGEGEVAVSLVAAGDWDYAGGHALLRGVGGELLDTTGQPITYSTAGVSGCGGRCFGGAPEIARFLATKDWSQVLQPPPLADIPYPLTKPAQGKAIANIGLLGRAQGCLLGQIAGDALGSLIEFQTKARIRSQYPDGMQWLEDGGTWNTIAGQPTDDSELALMLARSLVQSGKFDLSAIATAYAHWYCSQPFDMGSTTDQALLAAARSANHNTDPAQAAQKAANQSSQANGALMRISPLGIFGHDVSEEILATWARSEARLSHPHPVCQDASAVFVIAIRYALLTGATPTEVYHHVKSWAESENIHADVRQCLADAATHVPKDYSHSMGWVRIAFQNAFYQLLYAPTLEAGVVDTVMQGGDTDTNGAIAGALLGAVYGYEAVPSQWRDRVLTCRPISELAGVSKPRPKSFWPVDILYLAEHLLLAGQN